MRLQTENDTHVTPDTGPLPGQSHLRIHSVQRLSVFGYMLFTYPWSSWYSKSMFRCPPQYDRSLSIKLYFRNSGHTQAPCTCYIAVNNIVNWSKRKASTGSSYVVLCWRLTQCCNLSHERIQTPSFMSELITGLHYQMLTSAQRIKNAVYWPGDWKIKRLTD